ncbi:MAG: sigma-54 dependent transcriptional regulator [Planctomycetota bacterium]|nr:sigma-54 dependent transcriptional regulator [Planctomycetota bacterium]MDI6787214.1 sigma-54 dependent transcriptional regulator [Planctomycetota bacterium]
MKILLADDEKTITVTLGDALRAKGHQVKVVYEGLSAIKSVEEENFDCILLDLKMPGQDGMETLNQIKNLKPETPVVIITGFGTVDTAVDALKKGAYDYVQKPFYNEEILLIVERIERFITLRDEYRSVREMVEKSNQYGRLIGKSPRMLEVYQLIEKVINSDCNVLIEGESGTGKELVAETIHEKSDRRNHSVVKMSCSVMPETLIESELFGYEKGAFTGALTQKIGRFELADRGTVFIDDIDDMTPTTQMKFLRVLQEHAFERVGGTQTIKVDIRVIAATKKNLLVLVKQNLFREDLFYRLNVVNMKLPPIRERLIDIPLLLNHFIRKYGKDKHYEITTDTLVALANYSWPGNVRELENSVERAITMAEDTNILRKEDLLKSPANILQDKDILSLDNYIAQCEIDYIRKVFDYTKGDKNEMCRLLNISRKTLWTKLKEYGIEK